QWADYDVTVPAAGAYEITVKAACINADQVLEVCSGTNVLAKVEIPLQFGVWGVSKPVEIKLKPGRQTLRVQTPVSMKNAENHMRNMALKWFELKRKQGA
ncbi:MAG: hypothetical protein WCK89_16840, partial [bacterium]